MNTLFSINGKEGHADHLLCEIGEGYCCFAEANDSGIQTLNYTSFKDGENIVQALPVNNYKKVFVSSAFPKAILVPHKFYNSISNLEVSEHAHHQFYDVVAEWQIMTLYWMPHQIVETIDNQYKNISYLHAYSTVLKNRSR